MDALRVWHFGREDCRPGHAFGPAVRNHFLIHYICAGRGTFICEGRTYELAAGQAFLIEPHVVTEYRADHADPWRYAWIGFAGAAAPELMAWVRASSAQPVLTATDPVRAMAALDRMASCAARETGRELAMLGCLMDFLSTMQGNAVPRHTADEPSYLTDAARYIAQNYSYPITVAEIAAHANVSRSCLFRAFKAAHGCSVQDYLLRIRLSAASELLCTTALSVTEIAYSCGFSDANYFSKIFLKKKNMSPSHYRQLNRTGDFSYASSGQS